MHGVDAVPGSPAMALVVWTDDIDEAFAQLVSAGTPVAQPPDNTSNDNRMRYCAIPMETLSSWSRRSPDHFEKVRAISTSTSRFEVPGTAHRVGDPEHMPSCFPSRSG